MEAVASAALSHLEVVFDVTCLKNEEDSRSVALRTSEAGMTLETAGRRLEDLRILLDLLEWIPKSSFAGFTDEEVALDSVGLSWENIMAFSRFILPSFDTPASIDLESRD